MKVRVDDLITGSSGRYLFVGPSNAITWLEIVLKQSSSHSLVQVEKPQQLPSARFEKSFTFIMKLERLKTLHSICRVMLYVRTLLTTADFSFKLKHDAHLLSLRCLNPELGKNGHRTVYAILRVAEKRAGSRASARIPIRRMLHALILTFPLKAIGLSYQIVDIGFLRAKK
jgi:hypothetical protein